MATKKVTELVHADLSKNVVLEESGGDRNSGQLKSVAHHDKWVQVTIGNALVTAQLDADVTFTD